MSTMLRILNDIGSRYFTLAAWQKSAFSGLSGDLLAEHIRSNCGLVRVRGQLAQRARPATRFSLVRTGKGLRIWRNEEALERLIVCTNAGMLNQVPLNLDNTKENADLLLLGDSPVLYELKDFRTGKGGGTPLFAVAELLKNLSLCRRSGLNALSQVAVVAPESYYRKYASHCDLGEFFRLVESLADKFEAKISLLRIPVPDTSFMTDICADLVERGEVKWVASERKAYTEKTEILAEELVPHLSGQVREALAHKNWEEISVDRW